MYMQLSLFMYYIFICYTVNPYLASRYKLKHQREHVT